MMGNPDRDRIPPYKEALAFLGRTAELSMIRLQSLVSQRQLAVQLTTQLMNSMNETTKKIIGNIGGSSDGAPPTDPPPSQNDGKDGDPDP